MAKQEMAVPGRRSAIFRNSLILIHATANPRYRVSQYMFCVSGYEIKTGLGFVWKVRCWCLEGEVLQFDSGQTKTTTE